MAAQQQRLTDGGAGGFQRLRVQLLGQEFIGQTLVHQNALRIRRRSLRGHQRTGVMRGPGAAVEPQVAVEGLVAPRALHRRADGRNGRQAGEHARVAQRECERTMAAHRVAKNAGAPLQHRRLGPDLRQQLIQQIAFHAPVGGPRGLGGIQVKTCAHAKVPGLGLTGHSGTARAGVGHQQGQAQLGRQALRAGFHREGFFGAGQAGQEDQQRHLRAGLGLRRQIKRKACGQT